MLVPLGLSRQSLQRLSEKSLGYGRVASKETEKAPISTSLASVYRPDSPPKRHSKYFPDSLSTHSGE